MLKLIKAKKLFDGKGLIINNPVVVIEDNYIKDVGEQDAVKIPNNIEIIDLKEQIILPGLIDAHIHTFGSDISADSKSVLVDNYLNSENDIFRVARLIVDLKNLLFAGFTTVCDKGSHIGPDLSKVLEQEIITGPRLYSSGNYIIPTYGTWDQTQWPLRIMKDERSDMIADGVDECIAIVRRRVRSGARVIKIGTSAGPVWAKCENRSVGDHPSKQLLVFTLEEVRAIVDTAHRLKLKVCCHAIGEAAVRLAVDGGVDVIEHGQGISEETRKLIFEKKVMMVTTLTVNYLTIKWGLNPGISKGFLNAMETHFEFMVKDFKKDFKMGIKLALGSDLWGIPYWPLGENSLELELMVNEIGMTPEQAIIAGTIDAAKSIGIDNYVGSLEPGKFADIISVCGDPLKDIKVFRNVKFVMKNGKTYVKNGIWVHGVNREKLVPDKIKD